MPRLRPNVALLAVVTGAALFRAAYLLQYRAASVFYDTPFLDAAVYDGWARRIAAGAWLPAEAFFFPPGYAYALGALYRVGLSAPTSVYVAQQGLGLLNIVLIHRIADRAFGSRVALAAAMLAALYAPLPFLETKLMSATLALTLLLGAIAMLGAAQARGGARRWAGAGVLLGATSLLRPDTLLAGPFLVAWLARWTPSSASRSRWQTTMVAMAALLLGWAAPIVPVAIHNLGAGGSLISAQGGMTFYQANNARARGLYVLMRDEGFSGSPADEPDEEKAIAERAVGHPLSRAEVSAYWRDKGLQFIRNSPGRFVWLLGMKVVRYVGSYEYSTEFILPVERERVWLLWLPVVPFALLVALTLPALPRRHGAGEWLLLAVLASNLLTVLVFYVSSRYRFASLPTLLVFAGATLVGLVDAVRDRRRAAAARTAALVFAVFMVAHFETDAASVFQEANAHFNTGSAWAKKGDQERAVAEFQRAIAMDATRYDFWFAQGHSLGVLGRRAEAAVAYGEAARRRPQLFLPRVLEGQMREELGDLAGARAAYERAEAINPDDFELELALGEVTERLGDREAAIRHLDHALVLRPDSAAARSSRDRL